MREIRTSGSMSGSGKPGDYATAPRLDSTETHVFKEASRERHLSPPDSLNMLLPHRSRRSTGLAFHRRPHAGPSSHQEPT
jgi:hypothetical protein